MINNFVLKNHCFFCGDVANKEKYEKKRAKKFRCKLCMVHTLLFKECVLKLPDLSPSDNKSKTITAHISLEFDLVCAEASYHNDYYVSFFKTSHWSSK